MLGALTTRTRDADYLDRIESLAESIAYVSPELVAKRRTEIIADIRRICRERRAS